MTNATNLTRAQAYAVGLVNLSVCAPKDMPPEIVEQQMNADHPTGIDSRWKVSEDEAFTDGSPIPRECEHDPRRQHWLLNC